MGTMTDVPMKARKGTHRFSLEEMQVIERLRDQGANIIRKALGRPYGAIAMYLRAYPTPQDVPDPADWIAIRDILKEFPGKEKNIKQWVERNHPEQCCVFHRSVYIRPALLPELYWHWRPLPDGWMLFVEAERRYDLSLASFRQAAATGKLTVRMYRDQYVTTEEAIFAAFPRRAHQEGMTLREVAEKIGLSHQLLFTYYHAGKITALSEKPILVDFEQVCLELSSIRGEKTRAAVRPFLVDN